jgi:hypothetical protein
MQFLGALRGQGKLSSNDGQEFGSAEYDIDGFLNQKGETMASGELRLDPERLAQAFGRNDLQLQTEGGVSLAVRFSAKLMRTGSDAAHIDVTGGLPAPKDWRKELAK